MVGFCYNQAMERLKYFIQLFIAGFVMWMVVTAGLAELLGRTAGVLLLGLIIVIAVFVIVYLYGDKLTRL
jgi:hypothetical protein